MKSAECQSRAPDSLTGSINIPIRQPKRKLSGVDEELAPNVVGESTEQVPP